MRSLMMGAIFVAACGPSAEDLTDTTDADPTGSAIQFRDDWASAWAWTGDDCGFVSIGLWGSSGTASAYVSSYDWCTGESWDGRGEGEAALDATKGAAGFSVPVTFYSTGQTVVGEGLVTSVIVGTGDLERGSHRLTYRSKQVSWDDRVVGTWRAATGTVSVVVNDTLPIERLEAYGELGSATSGTHSVTRW